MTEKIDKIGKYEIVSELGRGAMGIVYKGYDPSIDRFVAIKTLVRNTLDVDLSELEDRFKIEAKAAGRLTHPNIISIYEFGEDGDLAYIAMEFVEGCTLSELEKLGKQLEFNNVLHIMQNVLGALQYAHERGIVHRDIKPSNIMYTPDNDVKIADFGIARLESSTQTQFGTVIGTPGYMSPEQIMGQHVDHRSDIFSAGILLYELLTGERAFRSTNISATTYKVVHTDLPPPSRLCPTLPEAIDAVLARALAKQPDIRFQSASEFAQALITIQTVGAASASNHSNSVLTEDETVILPRSDDATDNVQTTLSPSSSVYISSQAAVTEKQRHSTEKVKDLIRPVPVVAQADNDVTGTISNYRKITVASLALTAVAGLLLIILKFSFTDTSEESAISPQISSVDDENSIEKAQVVIEKHKSGTTFTDCDSCPEVVVIPPGSFLQGAPENETGRETSEVPQHNVTITYPLAVGVTEVTRGQFSRFIYDTGYKHNGCWIYDGNWKKQADHNWLSPGFSQDESHPVTCVSWQDAKAYTKWLTAKTGRKYRLLSESEWEYVARGGATTAQQWDNTSASACQSANVADESSTVNYPGWNVHNCNDQFVHTAPAATFEANLLGLYDTLGNVFEWVEDCWNENYVGSPADGSIRVNGECDERVLRGGSWYSRPDYVRYAYRNRFSPDHRSSSFGFRIARELEEG